MVRGASTAGRGQGKTRRLVVASPCRSLLTLSTVLDFILGTIYFKYKVHDYICALGRICWLNVKHGFKRPVMRSDGTFELTGLVIDKR